MITKIKMMNFRGIKKGELDLAPLTILLGPNNAGKTTVLEALFLAPNPLRKVPYKYMHALDVIHSLHQTLESRGYAFLLFNYTAKNAEISCLENNKWKSVYFTKKDFTLSMTTNIRLKATFEEENFFGSVYLTKAGIFSEGDMKTLIIGNSLLLNSYLIQDGSEYLHDHWAEIINLGICRKVASEASNFSVEKYSDITIEPFLGGYVVLYAYFKDGRRIRLGDLGSGIQNYIIARLLYEVEKPEILLWDDIESHLNPRMITYIAEWFFDLLKEGKQIIVTTHSLEAARIIAGINEDAVIYLISMENNNLKSKKLTLNDVEKLLKAGIDVRVAEPMLL